MPLQRRAIARRSNSRTASLSASCREERPDPYRQPFHRSDPPWGRCCALTRTSPFEELPRLGAACSWVLHAPDGCHVRPVTWPRSRDRRTFLARERPANGHVRSASGPPPAGRPGAFFAQRNGGDSCGQECQHQPDDLRRAAEAPKTSGPREATDYFKSLFSWSRASPTSQMTFAVRCVIGVMLSKVVTRTGDRSRRLGNPRPIGQARCGGGGA